MKTKKALPKKTRSISERAFKILLSYFSELSTYNQLTF